MKYYNDIRDLIGNTPILKLNNISTKEGVNIYAKIEGTSPGGSCKDRVGIYMVEKAEKEGKTELAKSYKSNAILFLDLKKKAENRITKAEKTIEETDMVIDQSKANYEAKKFILDDLLAEFETMTGSISSFKFNQSLEVIQSLKRETADKLRSMNAEVEASNVINDTTNNSGLNEADYEEEFNKL